MKAKYGINGQFPCKANWIILKKDGNRIVAHNCLNDEDVELPPREAKYLQSLDGQTNPFGVEGYSYGECFAFYCELNDEFLLRNGKNLKFGRSKLHTVYIPKHKRTNSIVPKILNFLLMVLFLPVFMYGMSNFLINDNFYYISDSYFYIGAVFGLLSGLVLHELAHAMACWAYGGRWIEAGVMWYGIIPGAYCLIDTSTVQGKNGRMKQIQINLAGVEMNLLLAGVYMILIELAPWAQFLLPLTGMFFGAAFQNIVLSLLNLTFVNGLDGEHILSLLLGKDSIVEHAKENIRCMFRQRERRKYFRENGINGAAGICTSCVIMMFQVTIPLLIIAEIIYVAGGLFG